MAQSSDNNPNKTPESVAELVAALLALGIDVAGATARENAPAVSAAAGEGARAAQTGEARAAQAATPSNATAPASTGEGTHHAQSGGDEDDDEPPRRSALSSAPYHHVPATPVGAASGARVAATPTPANTGTVTSGAPHGFTCSHCQGFNQVRSASESFYVITIGLQVGVFNDWHIVQPLVSGVSGACYRRYSSEAAARAAFAEALTAGLVLIVTPTPTPVSVPGPHSGNLGGQGA